MEAAAVVAVAMEATVDRAVAWKRALTRVPTSTRPRFKPCGGTRENRVRPRSSSEMAPTNCKPKCYNDHQHVIHRQFATSILVLTSLAFLCHNLVPWSLSFLRGCFLVSIL